MLNLSNFVVLIAVLKVSWEELQATFAHHPLITRCSQILPIVTLPTAVTAGLVITGPGLVDACF